MTMTVGSVAAQVMALRRMLDDPEQAHIAEDQMYIDVLRAIADGAADPAKLALVALAATEIDYERWYA